MDKLFMNKHDIIRNSSEKHILSIIHNLLEDPKKGEELSYKLLGMGEKAVIPIIYALNQAPNDSACWLASVLQRLGAKIIINALKQSENSHALLAILTDSLSKLSKKWNAYYSYAKHVQRTYLELSDSHQVFGCLRKKIKIITWNIKAAYASSNRTREDYIKTLSLIGDFLSKFQPDIVLLQEVDRGCARSCAIDEAKFLAEYLDMNCIMGSAMDYQGGQYGLATLHKFQTKSSKAISLGLGSDGKEEMICLSFEFEIARKTLFVLNTHINPNPNMPALSELMKTFHGMTIMGGGLNCTPESSEYQMIPKHWASDNDFGVTTLTFQNPNYGWCKERGIQAHCKIDHLLATSDMNWVEA